MSNRIRILVIGCTMAALVITATAGPVAAAKTKLAIVNGIPGKRIDVCVNGREIKSGLRYGRFVFKTTRTANATVKFFKPDPRRCRGTLLAKRSTGIDDATIVITRRSPKRVLIFENTFIAEVQDPTYMTAGFRQASDLGTLAVAFDLEAIDWQYLPLSESPWPKGRTDHLLLGADVTRVLAVHAHRFGDPSKALRPLLRIIRGSRRWEIYIVGTRLGNARWIVIDRPARVVAP